LTIGGRRKAANKTAGTGHPADALLRGTNAVRQTPPRFFHKYINTLRNKANGTPKARSVKRLVMRHFILTLYDSQDNSETSIL
jgi:hypothetical protein